MIEQEYDGMYIEEYAEYHEYDNGCDEEQP
jgi:hypothetical protein